MDNMSDKTYEKLSDYSIEFDNALNVLTVIDAAII